MKDDRVFQVCPSKLSSPTLQYPFLEDKIWQTSGKGDWLYTWGRSHISGWSLFPEHYMPTDFNHFLETFTINLQHHTQPQNSENMPLVNQSCIWGPSSFQFVTSDPHNCFSGLSSRSCQLFHSNTQNLLMPSLKKWLVIMSFILDRFLLFWNCGSSSPHFFP